MTINDVKDKLANAYHLCVDKCLIHNLTANGANVYTELVTRAYNYEKKGTLSADGYFSVTVDDLEYELSITQRQQTPIIKDLVQRGLIAVEYKGFTKKRYIKVLCNQKAVDKVFEDTRIRNEKEEMPEETKTKMNPFDPEILNREIVSEGKKHGTDRDTCEKVITMYEQYHKRFGYPVLGYKRESVGDLLERIYVLDLDYDVLDPEMFSELLDVYEENNMNGYNRSINNMLSESNIEIFSERMK